MSIELPCPAIMGIVNITPDSFSDRGKHFQHADAIAHAHHLVEQGASIIDVGGASTRPGYTPVPIGEECRRVIPVIQELACIGVPISIDTTSYTVAVRSIDAGATIINDISCSPDLMQVSSAYPSIRHVIMMNDRASNHHYTVDRMLHWFTMAITEALSWYIPASNLILDPGLGFKACKEDNYHCLQNIDALTSFGCPILIGPSRKNIPNGKGGTLSTLDALVVGLQNGAHILRVHDVALAQEAIAKVSSP